MCISLMQCLVFKWLNINTFFIFVLDILALLTRQRLPDICVQFYDEFFNAYKIKSSALEQNILSSCDLDG